MQLAFFPPSKMVRKKLSRLGGCAKKCASAHEWRHLPCPGRFLVFHSSAPLRAKSRAGLWTSGKSWRSGGPAQKREPGVRVAGRRFMSFTVHLQSKTKIAETPVFCFIGSVNKHINFYDISGGLLKGKKIHPLGPGQQQWQHMVC